MDSYLSNMEVITVTSKNQDPAKFVSNFTNSIRLSKEYEVALLKIAFPPVINVTEDNNKLHIQGKDAGRVNKLVIEVPTGFYSAGHDLAQAMFQALSKYEKDNPTEIVETTCVLRYSTTGIINNYKATLQLEPKNGSTSRFIANESTEGNILRLLDFKITQFTAKTLTINNDYLIKPNKLGFLYSSIVSNSLIDNHVSRLLDTVEIKTSDNGEHYVFENQSPVFHDVSAASFIDISFEIRDVDGDLIQFKKDLPTILTLGIRKKQIIAI